MDLLYSRLVFLNNDRKRSTSNIILTITPPVPLGLSMLFHLIHGKDHSCPAVVGILNGTGERPQSITRTTIPIKKAAMAAYGTITPNKKCKFNAPTPTQGIKITSETANPENRMLNMKFIDYYLTSRSSKNASFDNFSNV